MSEQSDSLPLSSAYHGQHLKEKEKCDKRSRKRENNKEAPRDTPFRFSTELCLVHRDVKAFKMQEVLISSLRLHRM